MFEAIFARIRRMYDTPHMQNSLRGQWGRYTGGDWATWDFERDDGDPLTSGQLYSTPATSVRAKSSPT
jgi:hypothetical protein